MKRIVRKYIWTILIFVLLILFPQSLSTQAELNMRVIISGIGIDFVDSQYQVTAQVVLSSQKIETGGINAQLSQISATGNSIANSLQQVSQKIGKITELSHMEYVIVGESFFEKNLASELDYFVRNFKLKNSIMLLTCKGESKEILSKMKNMDLSVALSLQRIWISTEENMSGIAKTYAGFVGDTYSACGSSVIDSIEFESKDQENADSQNLNSESSPVTENFKVYSELNLFKDGKHVGKLEEKKQILGYYYGSNKNTSGNLTIDNFSFGDIQNAKINLRIDKMKKKTSVTFVNEMPVLNIYVCVKESHIDEIATEDISKNIFKINFDKSTKQAIINQASETIKQCVYSTFQFAKQNNFDIFQIANFANASNQNQWKKYLNNLANSDEYLSNIELNLQVDFLVLR